MDKESYLLELARYIVLNPVRAERVRSAREWPWSSYRATAGQVSKLGWLMTDWLLASFGGRKKVAIERYRKFVSEGKGQPSPWNDLRNQVYLGDRDFVTEQQGLIDGDKELSKIPISQRLPKPLQLEEYEAQAQSRDEAIARAYQSGGYTQKDIGEYFGLHCGRISRIVKKAKDKA